MQSKATTVSAYLASLPPDRRAALEALRKVILANKDKVIEEGMQYGMVGYYIPHSVFPKGYHCDPKQPLPFAGIASQKNHMSLHLFCIYGGGEEQARFEKEWKATGKKLDMGSACVRFKKIEDVPLEVVAGTFKRMTAKKFIAHYEANVAALGSGKPASTKAAKKASKKAAAEPAAKKSTKKPAKKAAKQSAARRS